MINSISAMDLNGAVMDMRRIFAGITCGFLLSSSKSFVNFGTIKRAERQVESAAGWALAARERSGGSVTSLTLTIIFGFF